MRVEILRIGLGVLLLVGIASDLRAQDPTPNATPTPAAESANSDSKSKAADGPRTIMVEKLDSHAVIGDVPLELPPPETEKPKEATPVKADLKEVAPPKVDQKNKVDPLDVWYIPRDENSPTEKGKGETKKKRKRRGFGELLLPDDDYDDDIYIDEFGYEHRRSEEESTVRVIQQQLSRDMQVARFAKPKPLVFNREQVKRMRAALEGQRQRGISFLSKQRKSRSPDPRGAVEIRVCTMDLGNYGLTDQVKRTIRKVKLRDLRRYERSMLKTVGNSGCQIVAVQALLGRNFSKAREAADRFAGKLGPDWKFYIGNTEHKFAYLGFLVDTSKVSVSGLRSHTDKLLPRFGEYQERKFLRAPVELRAYVPGKEGKPGREMILINFDFHNQLPPELPESSTMRMQMADALRQLVASYERTLDPENPELIVVLGNRNIGYNKPSGRILEGQIRLTDFRAKGACKLKRKLIETEEKVKKGQKWKTVKKVESRETLKCKKKMKRQPVYLYGLLARQLPPPPTRVTKVEVETDDEGNEVEKKVQKLQYLAGRAKKRWRGIQSSRKVDIYLLEPELEVAVVKQGHLGRFAAGTIPVENGVKYSPLVWADLNW